MQLRLVLLAYGCGMRIDVDLTRNDLLLLFQHDTVSNLLLFIWLIDAHDITARAQPLREAGTIRAERP